MNNKFVKLYQQFWVPEVGDTIKIIKLLDIHKVEVEEWHYKLNEIGEIKEVHQTDEDGYVYVIQFKTGKEEPVYREEIDLL